MERITLDTNCLLEVVTRKSKLHYIWEKILAGDIVLCVTTEILCEYEEKLAIKSSPLIAKRVMFQLENTAKIELITTYYRWNLIKADPDDNKFVDCAIAANSRYIVSSDKHFKVLLEKDMWPKLNLKTLKEYHEHLYNKAHTLSGTSHRKTARPRPRKKK